MTPTEIATIFTALTGGIVALFTFWNTRQANQIKRLSDAAVEHKAERDADLEERKSYQESINFWKTQNDTALLQIKSERDARAETDKQHAVLRTQHDETRRQLDAAIKDYRDLNVRFEKRVTEIEQLRRDMSKQGESLSTATVTIQTLTAARDTDHRIFEDTISRANDEHVRERDGMQRQINELTEQVRLQSVKIKALQDQLREFGDANMALADRVEKLQNENEKLLDENKTLVGELARLGKFVGPYDYVGYGKRPDPDPEPPTPPDHKAPLPLDSIDTPDLSRSERAA